MWQMPQPSQLAGGQDRQPTPPTDRTRLAQPIAANGQLQRAKAIARGEVVVPIRRRESGKPRTRLGGLYPSGSEQAQAQLAAVGDAAHFLAHQLHVVDRATQELARQWYAAAHCRARACRKDAELEPVTAEEPLVGLQAESANTEHNCQEGEAWERAVARPLDPLGRKRVLHRQAQVVAAPRVRRRLQNQLTQRSPPSG